MTGYKAVTTASYLREYRHLALLGLHLYKRYLADLDRAIDEAEEIS